MTMKTYSRKKTKPIADDRSLPQTSPAAELIANSIDLLTQILLRLPAKSVLRFKSLSKHWLSLLSDSGFASSHCRLNPKPLISSLYFYYNRNKLESVSLDGSSAVPSLSFLHRLTGDFRILQSRNGLLLIKVKSNVDCRVKAQFIVCNPITQKFRVLAGHGGGFYESLTISLAFDPSKSPHYKVVLLYQYPPKIEIYSSETACWKNLVIVILYEQTLCIRGCYRNDAFWNGALYWLCDDRYNVLRFDAETEKIYVIPYTQRGRILPLGKTRYFGDCGRGGRLLLIQSNSHSTSRFKICEMDEDCCRWNVKLHVDLRTLISEFPETESQNFYKFTVMCVVEGEDEEEDIALILAIPGKIISCNPQKRTWKVLRDFAPGDRFINSGFNYDSVFPFVESLFPV